MATFKMNESFVYAKEAGADLTASLNRFMTIDASGNIVRQNVSGGQVLGTLFEVPLSATTPYGPATVQFGCIAKVRTGAAIAAGARVQSDGEGRAITLAGGIAAGVALEAATAADQYIPVVLGL